MSYAKININKLVLVSNSTFKNTLVFWMNDKISVVYIKYWCNKIVKNNVKI